MKYTTNNPRQLAVMTLVVQQWSYQSQLRVINHIDGNADKALFTTSYTASFNTD